MELFSVSPDDWGQEADDDTEAESEPAADEPPADEEPPLPEGDDAAEEEPAQVDTGEDPVPADGDEQLRHAIEVGHGIVGPAVGSAARDVRVVSVGDAMRAAGLA